MARTFTRASLHRVQAPLGNMGYAFNPGTLAFIARKASDPAAYAVPVAPGQSDGTTWFIWTKTSTDLAFWSSNEDTIAPFGWAAADGWCLIAATRAAGAGGHVIRFHKYVFATNAWTHQDSAAATATFGGSPALHVNFGCEEAGPASFDGFFDGDIAIAGAWDVQFTDAQIEALPFTLPPWLQVNPRGLWLFDQDTIAQKVVDFSGGGANESAISGTAVASSSVPVFNYGAEIWLPAIGTAPGPVLGSTLPLRIANARVGPMALRNRFRRAYAPQSAAASSTTPVSSVAGFPFEALQQIAAAGVEPVEAAAGIAGSGTTPFEALQGLLAALTDPIEGPQGIAATDPVVLEALAGIAGSGTLPFESLRAIATQLQDAFEALAAAASTSSAPIEAGQGIAATDALVLEALGGVAASGADPFEAQGNVPVAQTLALAFEALAGTSTPGTLPVETVSALAAAAVAPVEAVQALSRAQAAPVEAPAGVARAAASPLESLARIASSPAFPFEARLAAALVGFVVAAFDPPDPQAPTGGGFDPPRPSGMFDTPDPGPAV